MLVSNLGPATKNGRFNSVVLNLNVKYLGSIFLALVIITQCVGLRVDVSFRTTLIGRNVTYFHVATMSMHLLNPPRLLSGVKRTMR